MPGGLTLRQWQEKGYDKHMGARPMERVIQEHIKKPLAEELLFGQLEHGGAVKVIVESGQPPQAPTMRSLKVISR